MPLHTTKKWPDKGWVYRELIGGKYWTNPDPLRSFMEVAQAICQARANNPATRATAKIELCVESLENYTCKRLNGDGRWCIEGMKSQAEIVAEKVAGVGCRGCGRKKK